MLSHLVSRCMIARPSRLRHWAGALLSLLIALTGAACVDATAPGPGILRVVEVSPPEPPAAGTVPEGGQGWQSVSVGRDHACALDVAGVAWCWGSNAFSQVGTESDAKVCGPPATLCVRTPARVETELRFQSVTAGGTHSCGVAADGRAYCWGTNRRGQLGTTSPQIAREPVAVIGERRWIWLAAGLDHTCGIAEGGGLYCWGANERGQIGNQTFVAQSSPVRIRPQTVFMEVAASGERTCALSVDGEIFCWGVIWLASINATDWSTTMTVPTRVRSDVPMRGVSVGALHACGIEPSGAGGCWGSGLFGQRGDGGVDGSTFPRTVRGGLTFHTITAGSIQTCGVAADRRAWCWGNNSFGQLGTTVGDECLGTSCTTFPVPVAVGMRWIDVQTGPGNHVCGITTLTNLYCWGLGSLGQLGVDVERVTARRVPSLVRPRG
ncbi:MAG: hypothetical protein H0X64_10200 [Gemmatimonadaceae bacterium]|nr:hypothetical protein [Gemmatimonadaceae bacterium]